MRRAASLLLVSAAAIFAAPHHLAAITIPTVPIGNVGNASDANGLGDVAYAYNMGTTEITLGQYTAFLNSVAKADPYQLYRTSMSFDTNIAGITRTGVSGSYTYSVVGSPNKPVTYVSWSDVARFANWMHNRQPIGPQSASTTEDGAYTLNGATTNQALTGIARNVGARWFIPSDDEWYKAAYHQPASQGGDTDNYWAYPTTMNLLPISVPPSTVSENAANYLNYDSLPNGYNDGYAVTGSPTYSGSQNYLTDVGSYPKSKSFYGTLDQAGNVWEWNEAPSMGGQGYTLHQVRGGAWDNYSDYLRNNQWLIAVPGSESPAYGFRMATVVNEVPVTTLQSPTVVDLGGGTSSTGGIKVDFIPSSAGSFQGSYGTTNVSQLPSDPAFAPGNFTISAPGSSLQYWDLHYTGALTGPASLTFNFDPSLITPGSTVGIWHFNSQTGWEFLGGTIQGNTITVSTTSFSPFALGVAPSTADFNGDGTIDAADYVVWRKNNRSQQDYNSWRTTFGNSAPAAGTSAVQLIPEPSSTTLSAIGLLVCLSIRHVRSTRGRCL